MEVTCNVIRDLLPLYVDKLTSPDTNRLVEEHLVACSDCSRVHMDLSSEMDTTVTVPTPAPQAEKQLLGRIRRHMMLSKVILLALGTLFGTYATTKGQVQAPFIVYPLIGIAGEVLIGGVWVAPLVVLVVNSIGALIFWDFHFGSVYLSGILAVLTLVGSLIAYSAKRVLE